MFLPGAVNACLFGGLVVSFAHAVRGALLSLILVSSTAAFAGPQPGVDFPMGPRIETTPGETCQHPDSFRYPEHVPYCSRSVTTQEKNQIIAMYDAKFGYHIQQMNRQDFKIDLRRMAFVHRAVSQRARNTRPLRLPRRHQHSAAGKRHLAVDRTEANATSAHRRRHKV